MIYTNLFSFCRLPVIQSGFIYSNIDVSPHAAGRTAYWTLSSITYKYILHLVYVSVYVLYMYFTSDTYINTIDNNYIYNCMPINTFLHFVTF